MARRLCEPRGGAVEFTLHAVLVAQCLHVATIAPASNPVVLQALDAIRIAEQLRLTRVPGLGAFDQLQRSPSD